MKKILYVIIIFFTLNHLALAQVDTVKDYESQEDLNIGGDIFSDFNEDLEATQVAEDERFYRYGRFFAVNIGLGYTTFTGNRGVAYPDNQNNGLSWTLSTMYFQNFQIAYLIGLDYSTHMMTIDTYVRGSQEKLIGTVTTTLLRPFFGGRYYFDTADLGTAITYANPYATYRLEYWYQTNTFQADANLSNQTGGGLGTALGFGLEFPMELRKSYFNVEFLYHMVNFFDKATTNYQQVKYKPNDPNAKKHPSKYGYDDLTGNVITLMFAYNSSW